MTRKIDLADHWTVAGDAVCAVCTQLLQDLLARGLAVEGRLLCVIDGGKGLRRALQDVFGDVAVIQRCQVHKRRNLQALLPQGRQAYVRATPGRAYRAASADAARRQLRRLAAWLEQNGHGEAAASLREGLEETLTVLKLGLPPRLRRFFATTNAIENLIGTLRHVARNVKRWRDGTMIRRWVGLGVLRAARGRASRMIITVRARRAATSRPALAPGAILRQGAAMSGSPHDRVSAIFTTAALAVCCAPEPPRSAKFNSGRDNPYPVAEL